MSLILLVQPPVREFYLTRKRTIPYGLISIAAGLDSAGFKTEIIDALATDKSKVIEWPDHFDYLSPYYGRADSSSFSLFHTFKHFGYSHEHIGCLVRDKQPLAVGISSLFTAYADQALDTARAVKRFYPKAVVILGGHHPTLFPEAVLACQAVDFVLRGEGEASMAALCRALEKGSKKNDLKKIPGIGFKTKGGVYINDPAWVKDLDSLPLPATEKINRRFYRRSQGSAITVVASRGCPFACSYCSVSAVSSHARFRRRKVGSILEEIRIQAEQGEIGFIDFEDENLTLNKDWVLALLSGIKQIFQDRAVELRAMNGLYPPSLDHEIVSAMKNAGFRTLNLSVGSFSKDQLKKFGRPDVRKAHDRSLEMAESLGLDCVSYIIGAAPGQGHESSLNDLVILARQRTLAGFSIFYPAPGSKDYTYCQKAGLLPPHFSLMRSTALPLDQNQGRNQATSRIQAVTLARLTRILNYLKHIVDTKGRLPEPVPAPRDPRLDPGDRETASDSLVRWFLEDGIIRGMDKDGRVYVHTIDRTLAAGFSKRIKKVPIWGVSRGPAGF